MLIKNWQSNFLCQTPQQNTYVLTCPIINRETANSEGNGYARFFHRCFLKFIPIPTIASNLYLQAHAINRHDVVFVEGGHAGDWAVGGGVGCHVFEMAVVDAEGRQMTGKSQLVVEKV